MRLTNPFMILLLLLLAACRQGPEGSPAIRPLAEMTPATAEDRAAEPTVAPPTTAVTEPATTNEGAAAEEEQTTMAESTRGTISSQSFHSTTLDEAIAYNTYLPAGYDESDQRYPVFYLLHGRGDSLDAWTIVNGMLNEMIAAAELPPVIVVMPDAPYSNRGSYYVDSEYTAPDQPGRLVESALINDLLPHVDATYRTIAHREARAVGGYSMGGYGALRYALAHPDQFMGALILSPAVYYPQPPADSSTHEFGAFGKGDLLFDAEVYEQKNYPALLEQLPTRLASGERLHFFIAVGDDEWKNPRPEDYQHDLDFEAHVLFNRAVRAAQITAELRVLDGGHDWDVWLPAFAEGARYLLRRMSLEPQAGAPPAPPPEISAATPPAAGTVTTGAASMMGTAGEDLAGGLAADADGNLYQALAVAGSLEGQPFAGGRDAALIKYAANGEAMWVRQFGTTGVERPYGLALGPQGIYMAGYTEGDLDGQHPENREDDVFLAYFDFNGELLWLLQFGQPEVADRGYAIAADSDGNVTVAGYTRGALAGENAGDKDIFLAKFAADGSQLWRQQFGTWGEDKGLGLAVAPDGRIYLCGVVRGALEQTYGDFDAFLAAFDATGNRLWLRQFGSDGWDEASAVTVAAAGGAFVTGLTAGEFASTPAGDKDIFVAHFSPTGEMLTADQLGTEMNDKGADLARHPDGNLYVAAFSNGDLGGQVGKFDVVLIKYRPDLTREWVQQFGTAADDGADAFAERNLFLTSSGTDVVLSGLTLGTLDGHSQQGAGDVFLQRLSVSIPSASFANSALFARNEQRRTVRVIRGSDFLV